MAEHPDLDMHNVLLRLPQGRGAGSTQFRGKFTPEASLADCMVQAVASAINLTDALPVCSYGPAAKRVAEAADLGEDCRL